MLQQSGLQKSKTSILSNSKFIKLQPNQRAIEQKNQQVNEYYCLHPYLNSSTLQTKQQMAKTVLYKESERMDWMDEQSFLPIFNSRQQKQKNGLSSKNRRAVTEDKRLGSWIQPWRKESQQIEEYEVKSRKKGDEKSRMLGRQKLSVIQSQVSLKQRKMDCKISQKILRATLKNSNLMNFKSHSPRSKMEKEKLQTTVLVINDIVNKKHKVEKKNPKIKKGVQDKEQGSKSHKVIHLTQYPSRSCMKIPIDPSVDKKLWSELFNFQRDTAELNKERQYRRMKMGYKSRSEEKNRLKNTYLEVRKKISKIDEDTKNVLNPEEVSLHDQIQKKLASKSVVLTQIVSKLIKDRNTKPKQSTIAKPKKYSQNVKGEISVNEQKDKSPILEYDSMKNLANKRSSVRQKIEKARFCNSQIQQNSWEEKQVNVNWLDSKKNLKVIGNLKRKQFYMNSVKPTFIKSYEYPSNCFELNDRESHKGSLEVPDPTKKINIFDNNHRRMPPPFALLKAACAENSPEKQTSSNISMEYLPGKSIFLPEKNCN